MRSKFDLPGNKYSSHVKVANVSVSMCPHCLFSFSWVILSPVVEKKIEIFRVILRNILKRWTF